MHEWTRAHTRGWARYVRVLGWVRDDCTPLWGAGCSGSTSSARWAGRRQWERPPQRKWVPMRAWRQDRARGSQSTERTPAGWFIKATSWKQSNCPPTEKCTNPGCSLTGRLYVNGKCVNDVPLCIGIQVEEKKQIIKEYLQYGSNSRQAKLNFVL